jgi:hypothetical protein
MGAALSWLLTLCEQKGGRWAFSRLLRWTWRQKFIQMLTLLSKGVPTKFLKFFWLKIFFICHRCQRHRWSTLSCKYLREFSKKFGTILMGYSGAGGKLIHEKNQKQKISWHCPFNLVWAEGGRWVFSGILTLCEQKGGRWAFSRLLTLCEQKEGRWGFSRIFTFLWAEGRKMGIL